MEAQVLILVGICHPQQPPNHNVIVLKNDCMPQSDCTPNERASVIASRITCTSATLGEKQLCHPSIPLFQQHTNASMPANQSPAATHKCMLKCRISQQHFRMCITQYADVLWIHVQMPNLKWLHNNYSDLVSKSLLQLCQYIHLYSK